jgi:hypothetical protein
MDLSELLRCMLHEFIENRTWTSARVCAEQIWPDRPIATRLIAFCDTAFMP